MSYSPELYRIQTKRYLSWKISIDKAGFLQKATDNSLGNPYRTALRSAFLRNPQKNCADFSPNLPYNHMTMGKLDQAKSNLRQPLRNLLEEYIS